MLDWLIIVIIAWSLFTLGFFYKQSAIHEFRINQANVPTLREKGRIMGRGQEGVVGAGAGAGGKEESVEDLWRESIPLVLRGLPRSSLWTRNDLLERECYHRVPLFHGQTLGGWLQTVSSESGVVCPWQGRTDKAEALAKVSGVSVWYQTHLYPLFGGVGTMRKLCYQAWMGRVGVRRTYASWTCILPTDGDIIVTLFPETMEPYLPAEWRGGFPQEWTRKDTPFAAEIKYMDVVVRAGTCFFLPPHWYVSWVSAEGAVSAKGANLGGVSAKGANLGGVSAKGANEGAKEGAKEGNGSIPMVFTILYHSPISWLAEKLAG